MALRAVKHNPFNKYIYDKNCGEYIILVAKKK